LRFSHPTQRIAQSSTQLAAATCVESSKEEETVKDPVQEQDVCLAEIQLNRWY